MHAQVLSFLTRCKLRWPLLFAVPAVLEAGSYIVNGSPRGLFATPEYVGVDWRPGPGVNEIALLHEYRGRPDAYFDTIVSTEMLEHDPHWQQSVTRLVELLKPGGNLLLTCAGPDRPPHELACGPDDYYQGRRANEVLSVLCDAAQWERVHAETHMQPNDTYIAALGRQPEHLPRLSGVLSVIVPAVGNVDLTARCIASLRAHTRPPYEIILVDNGSTPDHAEALADLGADVYLRYDRLLGYPAAINRGLEVAQGEYVCLLNNDTEVEPYWASRLIAVLETRGAAIVSPVTDFIANPAQHRDTAGHNVAEATTLFFVCVLMRYNLAAEVGLLDERFGLGNCEDKEYCDRVKARGGKLVVEPGVFVQHVGHGTFGRFKPGLFMALLKRNEQLLATCRAERV